MVSENEKLWNERRDRWRVMVAYSVCLLKRLARKYKADVTSADKDLRGQVYTNFSNQFANR